MTTCAFWPQLQKTWTSKSAGDVWLSMLAILSCGVCLWFMYGLVLQAWPIILTNFITLLLIGAILSTQAALSSITGCSKVLFSPARPRRA